MAFNPAALMKIMGAKKKFTQNHPKFDPSGRRANYHQSQGDAVGSGTGGGVKCAGREITVGTGDARGGRFYPQQAAAMVFSILRTSLSRGSKGIGKIYR